jgi:hypothetical protein
VRLAWSAFRHDRDRIAARVQRTRHRIPQPLSELPREWMCAAFADSSAMIASTAALMCSAGSF